MHDVRAACVDDVEYLNALTGRSVLHWGYDPTFLEWEPEAITVTIESITDDHIMVIEVGRVIAGYFGLRGSPDELTLDKLFVDPPFIGIGLGRILWHHAVDAARACGAPVLTFHADPNAAGFYRAMGAVWNREEPTTWPGWNLQVFSYHLTPELPE